MRILHPGKDMIYESRDKEGLKYKSARQLEIMRRGHYRALMNKLKAVCFTEITNSDKDAIFMRPENTGNILSKYLEE